MTRTHVRPEAFQPPLTLAATWPGLWSMTQRRLRELGYRPGTLRVYRAALRGLAQSSGQPPSRVERRHVDFYLRRLTRKHCSASWVAMNLSVLRTVFDKCFGADLLAGRQGPRRAHALPEILQVTEVGRLLAASATPRDAFLLSLLYGCGLMPGEAIALRWGDFDVSSREVVVTGRRVPLPDALMDLIRAGCQRCEPGDWVFTGRRPGRPLGLRALSAIVHRHAREAGLDRPVSAMMLRHSFAAHQLQAGMSVRELQEQLGHTSVESTLRYSALEPPCVESPLDRAYAGEQRGSQEAPGVTPQTHTTTPSGTPIPPQAAIPPIPVGESEPPFPVEHPVRYFLGWRRRRFWPRPRRRRPPG